MTTLQPSLLWKTLRVPARIFTTTMFDIKVYGKRHVPNDGGVLLVSNHQSYLDPVLLGVQIWRPMSYMAKAELFENPLFSRLIRALHTFPIRRGEGDKAAMEQTIRELQSGKMLNMYPEGTRTLDGEIGQIERGIALVIRRAKVPVLPAVIDGSFEAWRPRQKIFRPWPIAVCYGPVMDLAAMDRERIVQVVGDMLRGMLAALREQRERRNVDAAALDARICALSESLMTSTTAKTSAKTRESRSASTA